MKKNKINPMPEYFDRYINKTDDVTHIEALEAGLQELLDLPMDSLRALGDKVYAPGKWTIKDIMQHIIDTERVFTYRVTAFSRCDTQTMLPYDEDLYAKHADATHRTLEDIVEELILLRRSTIALYRSFTDEMLLRNGKSYKSEYSVLAMGFMIPGHQRWHMNVIQERYMPLIGEQVAAL